MKGDKPTKSFFDQFKCRKEYISINSLIDIQGREVFDIKEIIGVAEKYFKELFSGQDDVQQSIIDFFLQRITPNENCIVMMRNLMNLISDEEIKEAIFSFINNRAPGPDGLSIEFYKTMYPLIKNELRKLFNGYLRNGRILAETKTSIIKLIPKDTPHNLIDNFRPISLLNCDYKSFTKIISIAHFIVDFEHFLCQFDLQILILLG